MATIAEAQIERWPSQRLWSKPELGRLCLLVGLGTWSAVSLPINLVMADNSAPDQASETESGDGDDSSFFEFGGIFLRFIPGSSGHLDSEFSIRNGLTFSDRESDFIVNIGGRMFVDLATYEEKKNANIGNSFDLSDARLEIEGKFSANWLFRISAGLTSGNTSGIKLDLRDMYLRYMGFRPIAITLGQHDEPFGLEELTSGRRITFIERGLPNALVPGRNFGAEVRSSGNWGTAGVGIFVSDVASFKSQGDQDGFGITGRVTTAPISDARHTVHVGASFSARNSSQNKLTIRAGPEISTSKVYFAHTGNIESVQHDFRFGLEAVVIEGPFTVQAEYIGRKLRRDAGGSDLWFDGWYASASWLVTGETRPWLRDIGNFGAIEPNNDFGAVEVAARFSAIDLSDKDIRGGCERNLSFGVNWYVGEHIRVMGNVISVWTNSDADGNGTLVGSDHPIIVQAQLQIFL